jgi:hypothetical protein
MEAWIRKWKEVDVPLSHMVSRGVMTQREASDGLAPLHAAVGTLNHSTMA